MEQTNEPNAVIGRAAMDKNQERALRKAKQHIEDALLHLHNAGIGAQGDSRELNEALLAALRDIDARQVRS
jgi:hypothetical protein